MFCCVRRNWSMVETIFEYSSMVRRSKSSWNLLNSWLKIETRRSSSWSIKSSKIFCVCSSFSSLCLFRERISLRTELIWSTDWSPSSTVFKRLVVERKKTLNVDSPLAEGFLVTFSDWTSRRQSSIRSKRNCLKRSRTSSTYFSSRTRTKASRVVDSLSSSMSSFDLPVSERTKETTIRSSEVFYHRFDQSNEPKCLFSWSTKLCWNSSFIRLIVNESSSSIWLL